MQAVKRVEIVVDYLESPRVCQLLGEIGIDGYTLIREATGRGDRGLRSGDDLRGEFTNSYLLVACQAEDLPRLVEAIRPVLKQVGGMCLISDALWVRH
jgi:nitrogen regulatory protein PII